MKALLDQEDSPVEYLLKKNNVTVNLVETKLDELIEKLPKIIRAIRHNRSAVMQIMWFCGQVRY